MHYLQPLKKYPFISNASYLNKGVTLRARSSEDGLHYLYLASGQWFSSLLRYIAAGSWIIKSILTSYMRWIAHIVVPHKI